ncbi:type VII secretion-associated serine protease [Sinosporangium siamense]|uniref:Type VII secretion-associated serine protease n=2 Tax=Sinosporangium siamense TaxID=1367973 RepID=A0A919RJ25_9ACTN|nr:type VII secretion-associated serine protease [Sinosporangium siamense]
MRRHGTHRARRSTRHDNRFPWAAVVLLPVCLAVAAIGGTEPLRGDGNPRPAQWSLTALRVSQAWQWSRGAGVTVAVLDTGADPAHPDLAGAVVPGPDLTGPNLTGRDLAGTYLTGPDLTGAAFAPGRWGKHGSAMASLIAGRGRGTGRLPGVLGVAPEATILSIKVTEESGAPHREAPRTPAAPPAEGRNALADGIRHAADLGARVISMSLGGGHRSAEGSPSEAAAVRYAIARGAVLVASSGNDGANGNRRHYPAAYPGVIAVGAVDEQLRVAPFSNGQDYVSVMAPGTRILAAAGGDSYTVGDGTSSAAALVAGIAALITAEFPALSPAQVREAIEGSATRRPPGPSPPAGIADAGLALRLASHLAEQPLPNRPAA